MAIRRWSVETKAVFGGSTGHRSLFDQ